MADKKKAKKGADGKSGNGDDKNGDGSQSGRRVELVGDANRTAAGLPGYLGVGMLGGIILGFGPLRDAAQGTGPFEDAMVRFVACLVFCVAAASFIGRVFDDTEPESGDDGHRAKSADGATGAVDRGDEAGSSGADPRPTRSTGGSEPAAVPAP